MKKTFAQMISSMDEELSTRMAAKVPEWVGCISEMKFPSRLCTEQCSSSATARGKAATAARIVPGGRIADLTGGLGVDSWAFSLQMSAVLHNERNAELAEAAAANFRTLGINNISTTSVDISPETIGSILDEFNPDMVYMDPARRSATGRKVFLLEDCEPDVLRLMPEIFARCRHLLLKVSPMADITMLASRLGKGLREVHVVEAGREIKELLLWVDRDWDGDWTISAGGITFKPGDEASSPVTFVESEAGIRPGRHLTEPSAALLKAGAFRLPCSLFGAEKLAPSTHLYISDDMKDFGKSFTIVDVLPFSKSGIKAAGAAWPVAEVTARNIPMSSDELRKRLGVKSGDGTHIFGVSAVSGKYLIICQADI